MVLTTSRSAMLSTLCLILIFKESWSYLNNNKIIAIAKRTFQNANQPQKKIKLGASCTSIGDKCVTTSGSGCKSAELSSSAHRSKGDASRVIKPSITDKARTITHVCSSGTLCTTSVLSDAPGYPFGSYVDYILDDKGWPVMLLSEQSIHTQNLKANPNVSLFAQLPRLVNTQSSAPLSRVTLMGTVSPLKESENNIDALKFAFSVIHPYSEQILQSPKFALYHLKPEKIYFSGGFGVMATWVDVAEYESAKADVLAHEVSSVASRTNAEKQGELLLICKHFLGLRPSDVQLVRIQAIDRLGIDLRVKTADFTDEYRVGFRHIANSSEDAKSEMVKLFQEAWEREQGYYGKQQDSATDANDNNDGNNKKNKSKKHASKNKNKNAKQQEEEDHTHDVGDGVPVASSTAAAYGGLYHDLPPFLKYTESS